VFFDGLFPGYSCLQGNRETHTIAERQSQTEATSYIIEQEVRQRADELVENQVSLRNSECGLSWTEPLTRSSLSPIVFREGQLEPPAFALDATVESLEGDREFLVELAGIHLDDIPGAIEHLAEAVEQRNSVAIGEFAHAINETVSNFVAAPSFAAALHLERIRRTGNLDEIPAAHQQRVRELNRLTTKSPDTGLAEQTARIQLTRTTLRRAVPSTERRDYRTAERRE
jgi:hypothetical protein